MPQNAGNFLAGLMILAGQRGLRIEWISRFFYFSRGRADLWTVTLECRPLRPVISVFAL